MPQSHLGDKHMETLLSLAKPENGVCSVKRVVEIMARALVDQPEEVFVSEISSDHSTIVELKVAREDIGKIIGKQGRNAGAMRTIVMAVAAKTNMYTLLEIID